ncbi:MucR family transcriptional regulator [Brucella gallinifaecis]|uniref:MucR family transcriptional regulator n=1 Tax=Brucella gallinifaecis TaxID=215590 RepID=UPI002362956D|nr:MucR family transcriptional regulator [Brucella gallinifaecis]
MSDIENTHELTSELTAQIVSAWASNNVARPEELVETIKSVHTALSVLERGGQNTKAVEVVVEPPKPAIPIKKSVTDDFIYSLFDGKPYKSLKRHLRTSHNMTPEEYRAHFGLPHDYPMVAPGYSKRRSALAVASGLGLKN